MVLLSARGARKVTNGRSRLVGCLLVSSFLAGKMGGVVSSALADRGGKGGDKGTRESGRVEWIRGLKGVKAHTEKRIRRKRGKEEGKKSASWERHSETQ